MELVMTRDAIDRNIIWNFYSLAFSDVRWWWRYTGGWLQLFFTRMLVRIIVQECFGLDKRNERKLEERNDKKCECQVGRNIQEKESVDNEQKKEEKLVYYLMFITVYGWNESLHDTLTPIVFRLLYECWQVASSQGHWTTGSRHSWGSIVVEWYGMLVLLRHFLWNVKITDYRLRRLKDQPVDPKLKVVSKERAGFQQVTCSKISAAVSLAFQGAFLKRLW